MSDFCWRPSSPLLSYLICMLRRVSNGGEEKKRYGALEEKGSIWPVSPLYYSYQYPQSHKTHPRLVAHLQNREIRSTYSGASIWAVSGEWLGRERPPFVRLISGQQMGNRQKWKSPTVSDGANVQGEGAGVRCNLCSPKMSPMRLSLLTAAKLVTGSHLYFIPCLTFGSCPSAVCVSISPSSFSLSLLLSYPHFVLAQFKYLMELTSRADLVELGKLGFLKVATSTTQLKRLRDRGV